MVGGPWSVVHGLWSVVGGEFTEFVCKLVNIITEFTIKLVNRTEFLTFEYDFKIVKRSD